MGYSRLSGAVVAQRTHGKQKQIDSMHHGIGSDGVFMETRHHQHHHQQPADAEFPQRMHACRNHNVPAQAVAVERKKAPPHTSHRKPGRVIVLCVSLPLGRNVMVM